jgi:vacuolar-type H+-ATPase subunit E/Vma4
MVQMVSQMTKEELQQVIESSVESKLLEMFGDPDDGLALRENVRKRLLKSKAAVKLGERGRPLDDIAKELGL